MQAKDIPVVAVLESIQRHGGKSSIFTLWGDDFQHVPFKVLRAKMDKLGKRQLVDCCCNECGSWIGLRPKGEAILNPEHHPHYSDSGQEK